MYDLPVLDNISFLLYCNYFFFITIQEYSPTQDGSNKAPHTHIKHSDAKLMRAEIKGSNTEFLSCFSCFWCIYYIATSICGKKSRINNIHPFRCRSVEVWVKLMVEELVHGEVQEGALEAAITLRLQNNTVLNCLLAMHRQQITGRSYFLFPMCHLTWTCFLHFFTARVIDVCLDCMKLIIHWVNNFSCFPSENLQQREVPGMTKSALSKRLQLLLKDTWDYCAHNYCSLVLSWNNNKTKLFFCN